jgi:hypothetical protein
MLNGLRNTLLFMACSLMLLHNFTPHLHQSEIGIDGPVVKLNAAIKSGLLQEVFQVDLGCNHLEEASKSKFNIDLNNSVIIDFILTESISFVNHEVRGTRIVIRQDISSSPPFLNFSSLRAPPLGA